MVPSREHIVSIDTNYPIYHFKRKQKNHTPICAKLNREDIRKTEFFLLNNNTEIENHL